MCRIAVRGDGKAGSPKHHQAQPSIPVLSSIAGWLAAVCWPLDRLSAIDAWVCDTLKQHIRPLVSAGLIVTTLLGALLLSAFFTAQIGVHLPTPFASHNPQAMWASLSWLKMWSFVWCG